MELAKRIEYYSKEEAEKTLDILQIEPAYLLNSLESVYRSISLDREGPSKQSHTYLFQALLDKLTCMDPLEIITIRLNDKEMCTYGIKNLEDTRRKIEKLLPSKNKSAQSSA